MLINHRSYKTKNHSGYHIRAERFSEVLAQKQANLNIERFLFYVFTVSFFGVRQLTKSRQESRGYSWSMKSLFTVANENRTIDIYNVEE